MAPIVERDTFLDRRTVLIGWNVGYRPIWDSIKFLFLSHLS